MESDSPFLPLSGGNSNTNSAQGSACSAQPQLSVNQCKSQFSAATKGCSLASWFGVCLGQGWGGCSGLTAPLRCPRVTVGPSSNWSTARAQQCPATTGHKPPHPQQQQHCIASEAGGSKYCWELMCNHHYRLYFPSCKPEFYRNLEF